MSSSNYSFSSSYSSSSSSSSSSKDVEIKGNAYIPAPTSGGKAITAVLINWGDDSGDGKSDYTKGPNISRSDKDLEKITLWVSARAKNLTGYRLQLSVSPGSGNIKVWADRTKTPLYEAYPIANQSSSSGNGDAWVIGTDTYPEAIYVEGVGIGTATLTWSLLEPINGTSSSTSVPVPQHDAQAVQVVAPYWKGFIVPERWQTSVQMHGIKKIDDKYYGDVSNGTIRTPFPNDYKYFPPNPNPNDPPDPNTKRKAANTGGVSAKSVDKYLGNFDISVEFDLVGEDYIHHATAANDPKPTFFRNSGIYIYGVYEIQIFDTAALMSYVGRQNNDPYKVTHDNTGFYFNNNQKEPENQCVSAVPYKRDPTGFGAMPNDPTRYNFDVVKNWIKPAGNVMDIEVRLSATGKGDVIHNQGKPDEKTLKDVPHIRVKVILNKGTPNPITTWEGDLTSSTGTNGGEMDKGYIWLQAHWGSGVQFTNVTITPRP